jgi:hypothetical protein
LHAEGPRGNAVEWGAMSEEQPEPSQFRGKCAGTGFLLAAGAWYLFGPDAGIVPQAQKFSLGNLVLSAMFGAGGVLAGLFFARLVEGPPGGGAHAGTRTARACSPHDPEQTVVGNE